MRECIIRASKENCSQAIGFVLSLLEENQYDSPDITIPIEQRRIGGLGIFLVKDNMDDVSYRYADSKNILTIKKVLD